MFRKILIPIDGSRTAARGLNVAARLAKSQKATLVILHVLDARFVYDSEVLSPYIDEIVESLSASGKKILAQAVAKARASGLKAKSAACRGIRHPGSEHSRRPGKEATHRSHRARNAWATWCDAFGDGKRRRRCVAQIASASPPYSLS